MSSADDRVLAGLAAERGTPLYVYRGAVIRDRFARLRHALQGVEGRILYAMKANRNARVLRLVRAEGDIGIDACSPREVATALEAGFTAAEISVTAGMLSNRDFARFREQGVHLNLDTLSAIRRWGAMVPAGTAIGLRLDPGVAIGYDGSAKLVYGNGKFGLAMSAAAAAAEAARAAGLVVDTLHMHCGWNLQEAALPAFETALAGIAALARRLRVRVVNVGGGLGARFRPEDRPLPPEAWGEALRRHLGGLGCTVACEPGTFAVAEAGVLVVEVNTVERRGDTDWVGVDAGHNVNVYAAHYGIPLAMSALGRGEAAPLRRYTVAGNINEPNDVFARDVLLPEVREGDLLVLHPAGAYGSSMASDHCLRGWAGEVLLG
ncbi:MAG: diaminopimelate decarboxylase [Magnetospirillum sp.]|nr:diaminopimelate decarboxylase [Magnetospirillum sp.]